MKKIQSDLDAARAQLAKKDKELQVSVIKAETVTKDLQVATQEIKYLKAKLKGNMSLIKARQLVWDEIIQEMNNSWKHITVILEKKFIYADSESSIINSKERSINNSQYALKFIHFLSEKPAEELRPMDIVDMTNTIVYIFKVISKEESQVKAKLSSIKLQRDVATFNGEFDRFRHAGLPNLWGSCGEYFHKSSITRK